MTTTSRQLGKTSVRLPAIGLGCAPLAGLAAPVPENIAAETLSSAWEAGVRYFDTSPWYGRGLSELRLGQFLRQQPRGEFIVSTKVGRTLHRPRDAANYCSEFWAGGLPFEHRFDYTYDGIMRSYESSLMRLGLNTVELLLIHDLDVAEIGSAELVAHHFQDLERSGWRALESLRDHGEVAALGAGVNIRGTIAEMLRRFDLDFFLVAMPYTLLDQAPLADEFPLCTERGVGIVIGSPFASGILATGSGAANPLYNYVPASPEIVAKTRRIEAVCGVYGVSLKSAAIQFPLLHPSVASVLCGAIGGAQARENAGLIEPPIAAELWDQLRREGLIRPDAIP